MYILLTVRHYFSTVLLQLDKVRRARSSLVILLVSAVSLLGVLPLHTSGAAATERRLEAEVDVLLGVQADDERGNVHDLFPDPDVPLFDEDPGVVDGFGQPQLEDLCLESSLQEVFNLETEHVIELHPGLVPC